MKHLARYASNISILWGSRKIHWRIATLVGYQCVCGILLRPVDGLASLAGRTSLMVLTRPLPCTHTSSQSVSRFGLLWMVVLRGFTIPCLQEVIHEPT